MGAILLATTGGADFFLAGILTLGFGTGCGETNGCIGCLGFTYTCWAVARLYTLESVQSFWAYQSSFAVRRIVTIPPAGRVEGMRRGDFGGCVAEEVMEVPLGDGAVAVVDDDFFFELFTPTSLGTFFEEDSRSQYIMLGGTCALGCALIWSFCCLRGDEKGMKRGRGVLPVDGRLVWVAVEGVIGECGLDPEEEHDDDPDALLGLSFLGECGTNLDVAVLDVPVAFLPTAIFFFVVFAAAKSFFRSFCCCRQSYNFTLSVMVSYAEEMRAKSL